MVERDGSVQGMKASKPTREAGNREANERAPGGMKAAIVEGVKEGLVEGLWEGAGKFVMMVGFIANFGLCYLIWDWSGAEPDYRDALATPAALVSAGLCILEGWCWSRWVEKSKANESRWMLTLAAVFCGAAILWGVWAVVDVQRDRHQAEKSAKEKEAMREMQRQAEPAGEEIRKMQERLATRPSR